MEITEHISSPGKPEKYSGLKVDTELTALFLLIRSLELENDSNVTSTQKHRG